MSTRSSITVQLSDRKYVSIYCHFDGYLSGVGKTLFEHYTTQEKVEELVKHGDLSQLCRSPDKPAGHTFETPVPGYNVYYSRDRNEVYIPRYGVTAHRAMAQNKQEFNYVWENNMWFLKSNMSMKSLMNFMKLPIKYTAENGNQEWRLDGKLHREGGPAIIGADGTQEWWVDGKFHRLDGPAVINPDGYQSWLVNGQRHRLDGPAVIWPDGHQYWFVNNIQITNEYDLSLFDSEEGRAILAIKYGNAE